MTHECRTCGKTFHYGPIDGRCGPCHTRLLNERADKIIEKAQEYDHIAQRVAPRYRLKYRREAFHYRQMAQQLHTGELLPGPKMPESWSGEGSGRP